MSDASADVDCADSAVKQRPKQSFRQRMTSLWARTGITWPVYKAMFKGALAPTICIAAYQADSFSHIFSTIGYLIAIISILSIVFRPRATYLQSLLLNVIFVCFSAAVLVLALFSIVKARENNPQPANNENGTAGLAAGQSTAPYNSSASAVAGLWLFIAMYILAHIRACGKQYMIPAIMGSILMNVGLVYAPQFANMTIGLTFVRTILSSMLVGMAIATAVALLVFPTSNRTVIFEDTTKYLNAMRGALKANVNYIRSLEHVDMFTVKRTATARHRPQQAPEIEAVKQTFRALSGIANKFQADLAFAKREIAIGYLGPDDLQEISRRLQMVYIPLVGLSCVSDMFERAAKGRGWDADTTPKPEEDELKIKSIEEWHQLVKLVKDPFQGMSDVIDRGLEHVLIRLRLAKMKTVDEEEDLGELIPGRDTFLEQFVTRMRSLHDKRTEILVGWCKVHGVELTADYFTNPHAQNKKLQEMMDSRAASTEAKIMRRQLYILLYMEFLLWSIGRRTEDFIMFVEGLETSGKLKRKRLIVPGTKRMIKWIKSTFQAEANEQDESNIGDSRTPSVRFGAGYQKKDPMHLPPANAWERAGDGLRKLAAILRSSESMFAFRTACATLSIAIVAFLESTQTFYTRERLFWAQIMIAIGMQPTASDGLKSSLLRILGTALFMPLALLNWYMVDGIPGGMIPFYFIFLHLGPWIIIKHPQYTAVGMIGPITITLIVGYGLQTLKIGEAASESNGQQYYPAYLLGPIRLATVLGGLFVAWIWTIFPFPVTEHQEQKVSLGRTMYLLAHYYSAMHETVQFRLRGLDTRAGILGYRGVIEKARRKIYMQCTAMLAGLRLRTEVMKFDIPLGGKFPRQQYADITELLQSMLSYMVLITYASTTFNDLKDANEAQALHSEWLRAFRHLVAHTSVASHNVATLLSLLASSVSNSEPLPPYLTVPEPLTLTRQLDELDRDILSVRHVAEPGYTSFAVTQLALSFMHSDLEVLVPAVKELVGVLDFSVNIEDPTDEKTRHAD